MGIGGIKRREWKRSEEIEKHKQMMWRRDWNWGFKKDWDMGNSGEGHLKTCPYESEKEREREKERKREREERGVKRRDICCW